MNKQHIALQFSRSAKTYDKAAVLQYEIGQRLLERLDYLKISPKTILDLGAGTGYLSQQLAQRYPSAHLLLCDLSPGMVGYAQSLYQNPSMHKHWTFICADAEHLPLADHSIDLIFSNLMLQWCPNLSLIFKEWRRVLSSTGRVFFSTLGPDTFRELVQSWAQVDEEAHTLNFKDMHDIGDQLLMSALQDPVLERENIQMHYKNLEQLIQDLKHLGTRNLSAARTKNLTGRKRFERWKACYEQFRSDEDDLLPLTFEAIYGSARQNVLLA